MHGWSCKWPGQCCQCSGRPSGFPAPSSFCSRSVSFPTLIFSWVFELTPEGLKRDEEVGPEQSIAPQTGQRMDRMIIVVLILALGYFAFDKFALAPRRRSRRGR